MTLIAKQVNFNGRLVETFGSILRKADAEDKVVHSIKDDDTHYFVEFAHDGVTFRGLWRESECLLVG